MYKPFSKIERSDLKENKNGDTISNLHRSDEYLINRLFNDLMSKTEIDEIGARNFKYLHQAISKFQYFRIPSNVTYFNILWNDLSDDVKNYLLFLVKDYCDVETQNNKLDGIMTEVIALIFQEAKPSILSKIENKDERTRTEMSINSIRSYVTRKWHFSK